MDFESANNEQGERETFALLTGRILMSKKKLVAMIFVLIAAVFINYLVVTKIQPDASMDPKLVMDVNCDSEELYQLYYSISEYGDGAWGEGDSVYANYSDKGKTKTIAFAFPSGSKYARLDLGATKASHVIENVRIECKSEQIEIDLDKVRMSDYDNMIASFQEKDGSVKIKTNGDDSYLVLDLSEYDLGAFIMGAQEKPVRMNKIILCVVIDVMLLCGAWFLNRFVEIPKEVYRNRKLVMNLAKNDFKTKYAGSYLGIIWAFVQPIVTIAVYCFVFQVGFRSGAVMDCPFVLWLMSGMVPWFFFSDALNGGTSSMLEYTYLVKKVVFKISILPIVKVLSALFVHLFFVFITIVLFAAFGYYPDLYTLQVVYYSFCMFVFVLGLCYATCAIVIFFRDLGQIISIFLQVGIWLTPIMWQETMVAEGYRWILKLNPIYYVVNGYREALVDKEWFWSNPNQLVYFWFVTGIVFVIGSVIFKRLKVHFADVL